MLCFGKNFIADSQKVLPASIIIFLDSYFLSVKIAIDVFLLLFFESGSFALSQTSHILFGLVKQLTLGIPSDEPVPKKIKFPSLCIKFVDYFLLCCYINTLYLNCLE